MTIFAPSDEAFKAKVVPDLNKLTNAEVVSLLQYDVARKYLTVGSLKTNKDPINTLATNGAGKYDLSVTTADDSVTLHTGVDSSKLADTVLDPTPLAIFTVESVLLPTELFGKSSSPAPAPEPVSSPSPTPVLAPAPGPAVEAPSPIAASPPAPAAETPGGASVDAPAAESKHSTSDKGAGVHEDALQFSPFQ